MDNSKTIITQNAKETIGLGEGIAKKRIKTVCLYGELGSGKTTFIQGYAKGLGMTTRLPSPTYIIVRRYDIPKSNDFLYHIDLYRISNFEGLGLTEIFTDPHAIVVVEWSEKLGELLPKQRTNIRFSVLDDGRHKITIR